MIVVKVQCLCNSWVRVRTMPDEDNPNHEYGWRIHTHAMGGRSGCGRRIEVERKGGHGARIVCKCDGIVRQWSQIDTEAEE